MKIKDIAWLAGVMVGDGTISLTRNSTGIVIAMSDRDVIERVAEIIEGRVSVIRSHKKLPGREHHKTMYRTSRYGAHAVAWLMTMYPLLFGRKKARAREVIDVWKLAPGCGMKEAKHMEKMQAARWPKSTLHKGVPT